MRPHFAAFACGAALAGPALAGAWPQAEEHGFALNQAGYATGGQGDGRLVFDGYGEAGLGGGWTAVFAFDSDLDRATSQSVWRAGGGLRYSLSLDGLPGWHFSAEATLRYQGHESLVLDPVFAGDGLGGGLRLDAGVSFELLGRPAFADLGIAYTHRRLAPAETRIELSAGIDVDPAVQLGASYAATFAPGEFFEPGAYEKHEVQTWTRWRIDADYALSLSLSYTVAADRAPVETAIRLGLWTFFYPEPEAP